MAVVEQDGSARLREARHLLLDGQLKTFVVRLESERSGELCGVVLDGLRIVRRNGLHRSEIALDALLLEGSFVEVGIGPDEEAGLAFDGGAKSSEVAASFRRNKKHRFFGIRGDGYSRAFSILFVPGVDFAEPVVRWLVGCAAKERDNKQKMIGLILGKISLDPDLIAGLEVWNLRDGQRNGSAGNANVNLRADKIEARTVVSVKSRGGK